MSLESVVRAVIGGALIGIAAAMALVLNGRIAGISGIFGRALALQDRPDRDDGQGFRIAFLVGLAGVGAVTMVVAPHELGAPIRGLGWLVVAGVLVGFGTAMGNGCTSGHGVCGIGRGSKRSLVAVMVFMATAAITVAIAGARS
jgi:uncharacterized protein